MPPPIRPPTVPAGVPRALAERRPGVPLGLFYAAVFGHLGIVLPFLAPWLEDRGYGSAAIGALLAIPALAKMVAPWTWARWADRTGRRKGLLVAAATASAAALVAMTLAHGWLALGLAVAAYGFARSALLPFVEATALEQTARGRIAYGPIRLWGSLAFVVASAGYGATRDGLDGDAGIWVGVVCLAAAACLAAALPRPIAGEVAADGNPPASRAIEPRERRSSVARVLAVCALMQVSHGAYYAFYSIHLGHLDYGTPAIGALWAWAVICEIVLLARLDRIVARCGPTAVLRASLLLAALRWVAIGTSESAIVLTLAQTLHAATYAAFHVAAIKIVFEVFGSRARARGQAMYSGVTFGVGMFAGTLGAGAIAASLGLPAAFLASAVVALAAVAVLGRAGTEVG